MSSIRYLLSLKRMMFALDVKENGKANGIGIMTMLQVNLTLGYAVTAIWVKAIKETRT